MVTAKTQCNLKNAEEYFAEHLCGGDYYDEGRRVSGEWIGLGAQRLGLAGQVRADEFLRLCEIKTHNQVTLSRNWARISKTSANIWRRRGVPAKPA